MHSRFVNLDNLDGDAIMWINYFGKNNIDFTRPMLYGSLPETVQGAGPHHHRPYEGSTMPGSTVLSVACTVRIRSTDVYSVPDLDRMVARGITEHGRLAL